MRLDRLTPTDLSVFAYSLLGSINPTLMNEYDALRATRSLSASDVIDLYDSSRMERAESLSATTMGVNGPLKKILSM